MKKTALHFRTLFLSDVHLGMADCKAEEVNFLLKHSHFDRLILVGDIIDALALQRGGKWRKQHTRFVRLLLKKMQKRRTEIIYIRGNHDDIVTRFLPLQIDKLQIVDKFVHETPAGKYLCIHGDGLDVVCTHHRWLMHLGNFGYDFMLSLNRLYNRWRAWRGLDYLSISKLVKERVKGAVSFVGNYEEQLQRLAERNGFHGIISGHIHTPADKMVGSVHYLNCGDWVESLTCVVEHEDRRLEVLSYADFLLRLEQKADAGRALRERNLFPASEDLPDEDEEDEEELAGETAARRLVEEQVHFHQSSRRPRRDPAPLAP